MYMVDATSLGGQELDIYYYIYGKVHSTWRTGAWAYTIIYMVDSSSPGGQEPGHILSHMWYMLLHLEDRNLGIYYYIYGRLHFTWKTGP